MDNVNHPSHYAEHCSVECIDMIRIALGKDGFAAYCLGNAIKYIWRHKYKNGKEDLQKADKYLAWITDEVFFDTEEKEFWEEKVDTVRTMQWKALTEGEEK